MIIVVISHFGFRLFFLFLWKIIFRVYMEEEEKKEMQDAAPAPEKSNREKLRELLAGEIDGYNGDDDEVSSSQLMDYINRGKEQRKAFSDVLTSDPRLAQVFSDVASKKRGAGAAFARYFGKDLVNAEEGSPEYEEIAKAEEERKDEMERLLASEKSYKENVAKSLPILTKLCEEKGIDPEQYMDDVWKKVIEPMVLGNLHEPFQLLTNGFNHDKDVEDAMAAGEVKGRNTNINRMREDRGDGMPKGMTSSVPPQKSKKSGNPLLEAAMKA